VPRAGRSLPVAEFVGHKRVSIYMCFRSVMFAHLRVCLLRSLFVNGSPT